MMKWSLLIGWLNHANQGHLLQFIQNVPVKKTNWFPDWVTQKNRLKFKQWDKIVFFEKGYKGTQTEILPLLTSAPYILFGNLHQLSGGVSLASQELFKTRTVIPTDMSDIVCRSNINYGAKELSPQSVSTFGGTNYQLLKHSPTSATVTASAKAGTKLRAAQSEMSYGKFKYTFSRHESEFSIGTWISDKPIGHFQVSKTTKGYKTEWHSGEVEMGQSLAIALSQNTGNLYPMLADFPLGEAIFKLGENHYAIKIKDAAFLLEFSIENKPSARIANGIDSRVSAPNGSRHIQMTRIEEKALFGGGGNFTIDDQNIWEYHKGVNMPSSGKEFVLLIGDKKRGEQLKGRIDNKTVTIGLSESPSELQQILTATHLQQIRDSAIKTINLESEYRFQKLIKAINRQDYPQAAQLITKNPKETRQQINQQLNDELTRVDNLLAKKQRVRAVQLVDKLTQTYGKLPVLTLYERLLQLGRDKVNLANEAMPEELLNDLGIDAKDLKSVLPSM